MLDDVPNKMHNQQAIRSVKERQSNVLLPPFLAQPEIKSPYDG